MLAAHMGDCKVSLICSPNAHEIKNNNLINNGKEKNWSWNQKYCQHGIEEVCIGTDL